jgi:hypothetical protein
LARDVFSQSISRSGFQTVLDERQIKNRVDGRDVESDARLLQSQPRLFALLVGPNRKPETLPWLEHEQ